MQDNSTLYILIMLFSVLTGAVSQVLLKKAALKPHPTFLSEYLNPQVIFAYALFVACTFLTVYAYRGVPLSLGPVLESTSYLYVTVFGILIFQEKINAKKIAALILIIAGVILTAIP